ncbi:hypothetical protein Kfla_5778 [Kribbella flavida DSM 17836]|uniref:Uncharacterized protein n=1 Tax=Kribbella flavida (strain DSM 17836 / JCM 10339 / NBRC 14399) TaxID=479435 RepID=D2PQ81_KRIFD|nr:hypothetical protein [Kribbella flavida]ADB34783.1 hypothetical protein Kfla_5778 [Kribbella flavida DSM 17836]
MGKRKDSAELARREQEEWQLGQDWARWLMAGNAPQPLPLYGIVLEQGETAYLQTAVHYARLYGGSGRYTSSGGFFLGSTGFVLGMMAANAAVNAGRKAAAKRDMQLMWRDLQEVQLIATNYRLMTHLPQRGWLSFYYNSVQEFYPAPAHWTITFGFQNAEPLQLGGLATPTLSVLTAWSVLGTDRWLTEPGIAPLLHAATSSQVAPGAVQGQIEGGGGQQNLPRIPGQD